MISNSLLRVSALCALAAVGAAQSFNIDIHMDPSATPAPTDGAYAGVAGPWNAITPSSTLQALVKVDGTGDNSQIVFSPVPTPGLQTIPQPYTALYEDFASGDTTITITNLEAGQYVCVLYSYLPDCPTLFRLNSDPNLSAIVTPPPIFPGYKPLESLAQIAFTNPTQNGSLTIQMLGDPCSVLNGIQLVHYVGTPGCPQAVANSLGAFPQIVGTGTIVNGGISVAANNLWLHVGLVPGNLPSGTPAILAWVSNDMAVMTNNPCPEVGSRCVGGSNLARVLDPFGAGGVGTPTPWGTYSVPVDFNALAAAGIDVSPGKTLHFQMFYRDVDWYDPDMDGIAQCGPVGGSVKRWTDAVSITLQ